MQENILIPGYRHPIVAVDVEASGPSPSTGNMTAIGAVIVVEKLLDDITEEEFKEISFGRVLLDRIDKNNEEYEKIGRNHRLPGPAITPVQAMHEFATWLDVTCKGIQPIFMSDNAGFDWQFVNDYFWVCVNRNPFGHSPHGLTSMFKGVTGKMRASFKHLRKTKHDHNPVNDARGNAEAWVKLYRKDKINW